MKVHRAACQPQYAGHMDPIWLALPPDLRGLSWAPRECWWGDPRARIDRQPADEPVMVAGFADARRFPGRPLIHVSHGAGQTYKADARSATHGSYAGGDGLDGVVLFLCPSESDAQAWRDRYPDATAVAVGVPRLDPWHSKLGSAMGVPWRAMMDGQGLGASAATSASDIPEPADRVDPPRTARPLVAVTFHWSCPLVPETQSAFQHYRRSLASLRDAVRAAGGELLGHGHPRAWGQLRRTWQALGVPHTPDQDVVFDQATMLVVDNSSAGPEAASIGMPVVWLSAPWYRRDVWHGGRFWEWVEGQPHVETPDDLAPTVLAVMADPTIGAESRGRMVRSVYAYTDGRAAGRAAAAIVALVNPPQPR